MYMDSIEYYMKPLFCIVHPITIYHMAESFHFENRVTIVLISSLCQVLLDTQGVP